MRRLIRVNLQPLMYGNSSRGHTDGTSGDEIFMKEDDSVAETSPMKARIWNRRRSSMFRPSTYYDSTTIHTSQNIEMLPIVILNRIFSYLRTPDLLNLCVTGRLFYLPAIAQLYKKIILVEKEDVLILIQSIFNNLNFHLGTVTKLSNINRLLQLLKNEKISCHVNSLVLVSEFTDIDNLFTKLFPLTAKCTHLREIISPKMAINEVGNINLAHLSSLTIGIMDGDDNNWDFNLPNLTSLKINYDDKEACSISFARLALVLQRNNILSQLKELTFQENVQRDLKMLNDSNDDLCIASWFNFFETLDKLKLKGSKVGALRVLSLDGFIKDKGVTLCRILDSIFDLTALCKLSLSIKEFSHFNQAHYPNDKSFLVNVADKCPNLTNLALNPTFDCLNCQFNMIANTLVILQNKLKRLALTFEFLAKANTVELFAIIAQYQTNLQTLNLYDKSGEFENEKELIKVVGLDYTEFERSNFYIDLFQSKYPGEMRDEELELVIKSMLNTFYVKNLAQLSTYMQQYFKSFNYKITGTNLQTIIMNKIGFQVIEGNTTFLNKDGTIVSASI